MKIAIISDLHGSLTALEQVLAQLAPGSLITICCSGICSITGRAIRCRGMILPPWRQGSTSWPRIMAVRGNCDSEVDQMLLHFPITAPYNQLLVDGRRWFVSHGHLYEPGNVPCQQGACSSAVIPMCLCCARTGRDFPDEPGSICFPRGEWVASYGRYDDGA